jgi:hypothetical protein
MARRRPKLVTLKHRMCSVWRFIEQAYLKILTQDLNYHFEKKLSAFMN